MRVVHVDRASQLLFTPCWLEVVLAQEVTARLLQLTAVRAVSRS